MTGLPKATSIARGPVTAPAHEVTLDYEGRFLRRKRLVADDGFEFLVDLDQVSHLDAGDGFSLSTGDIVVVRAADEPLLQITGDLARLAWHIGNRHYPCAVRQDHLIIREDKVLKRMLEGLGAHVHRVTGPFEPEGGAYGTGRVMGHDHGSDHGHNHGHSHDHDHAHDHDHEHHQGAGHD